MFTCTLGNSLLRIMMRSLKQNQQASEVAKQSQSKTNV
jgi:hypothetical protein